MQKNLELRDVCSLTSTKKFNRCRSFHFRYLELCRAKNLTPLSDIRTKNNATSMLDFFGEKLGVTDWLLIIEALYYDQVLQTLSIRLRKTLGMVLEHLDTEKKARLFKQKPVVCTKFVFSGIVEAVSNCIEFNKNLRILNLEGLPLNDKYVESIAKALSSNESLKEISFQRSNIYDKGCEAICNTIKYLENVEKLNLSECELSTKGAEHVAAMIKIQKISRYTEGWKKSLRYRDVDPDSIPGLRSIALARNPQIGDDGVKAIVEILKEDVWVKVIDMENCGLTDRAANMILDCLEVNNYIIDFNVRGNAGISKFLQRSIREQLGKEDEDQKMLEGQMQHSAGGHGPNAQPKKNRVTLTQLKEQLKTLEEQLAFERVLRKKAEQLNEKLNQQIIAYENQMENEANARIPEGYVVVKNESLQSIIKERNDFQKFASSVCRNNSPRNNNSRSKQINSLPLQHSQMSMRECARTSVSTASGISSGLNNVTRERETNAKMHQAMPSPTLTVKEVPRKPLKVRKVKSEMKYVEPSPKDSSKKKESKSDHEFANETDFQLTTVQFETNIGDSAANNMSPMMLPMPGGSSPLPTQLTARIDKKPINNVGGCTLPNSSRNSFGNKIEMDDLSISTSRSQTSDGCSSDSDTLRNSLADYQPLKVFIRRNKSLATQQQTQQKGQGEGVTMGLKSPRSLFLGLCDY
ncbi:PREDICTED: protein Cep78 homolog [Rhagoletis zephyria]|uniref:protein Cep78 homolog n=1 Tax=Rhagoletis zephyria TaxID=28612 RepID=UPI0008115334|nr:PREDICTED: protein Cep78 homolog [Rhagoletis zephyria]